MLAANDAEQQRTNLRLLYLLDHLQDTPDAARLKPVYSETLSALYEACATPELYVLLVTVYDL